MNANAQIKTSFPSSADELNSWFDERFQEKMKEYESAKTPTLAIIVTKGSLDMAYPPFILASTAAALGWNSHLFFTFYGLDLLKKDLDLQVTPAGNPAMPFKMPMGPKWFKEIDWNVPHLISNNIPGFDGFATSMMKKTLQSKGVASIEELREICVESEVKMVACQMTVDLFGYKREDFIDGISDWVGAASFLPTAKDADITLFI